MTAMLTQTLVSTIDSNLDKVESFLISTLPSRLL